MQYNYRMNPPPTESHRRFALKKMLQRFTFAAGDRQHAAYLEQVLAPARGTYGLNFFQGAGWKHFPLSFHARCARGSYCATTFSRIQSHSHCVCDVQLRSRLYKRTGGRLSRRARVHRDASREGLLLEARRGGFQRSLGGSLPLRSRRMGNQLLEAHRCSPPHRAPRGARATAACARRCAPQARRCAACTCRLQRTGGCMDGAQCQR